MKKFLFYFLSVTWGCVMTIIGGFAVAGLLITGHKPEKYGWCWHFKVGKNWGGVSLGLVFISDNTPSEHTKMHEHGHSIQNCILGPLMPFVVGIPSAIRYWYREYLVRSGKKKYSELAPYDSVWFEGDASRRGKNFIKSLECEE